jgi:putative transcriptional regulator
MALEWRLRRVMAEQGIWTGAELARLLWEKAGYRLTAPSISDLMSRPPRQLKMDTLDALCTALDCSPGDLLAHTPSRRPQSAGNPQHAAKGDHRNTRPRPEPPA